MINDQKLKEWGIEFVDWLMQQPNYKEIQPDSLALAAWYNRQHEVEKLREEIKQLKQQK